MKKYWIEYADGELDLFEAETEKDAFKYFEEQSEYAVDFGEVENEQNK